MCGLANLYVLQATQILNEDNLNYCHAWEEQTALTENLPSCQRPEFKYTSAADLQGLPYTANVDVYTGGGYVHRLNTATKQLKKDLYDLQAQHWVNNHTRAVFLEFSSYNANVSIQWSKTNTLLKLKVKQLKLV